MSNTLHYLAAVPKSMREIVCPRPSPGVAVWQCTEKFNSSEMYKLFVVLFGVLLSPFVFGHVHKTRTLQIITTVVRHVSFALMCSLALVGIIRGEGRSVPDVFSDEHPAKITTFFGVCIYSFMCHHRWVNKSLPLCPCSQMTFTLQHSWSRGSDYQQIESWSSARGSVSGTNSLVNYKTLSIV